MSDFLNNTFVKLLNIYSNNHRMNKENMGYWHSQLCEKCDLKNDSGYFEKFKEYKTKGLCESCYNFDFCVDFRLLQEYESFNDFINPFNKKPLIEVLKEHNMPLLRGRKSIGEYIDLKPIIEMGDINMKMREISLKVRSIDNNFNIFNRNLYACHNINHLFENDMKYNEFITNIEKYLEEDPNVDYIIIDKNKDKTYTKEHALLISKKITRHYRFRYAGNNLELLINKIGTNEINSKNHPVLFVLLEILEFISKYYINGTILDKRKYSACLIKGFILDSFKERTEAGAIISQILRESRKNGTGIVMVDSNEWKAVRGHQ